MNFKIVFKYDPTTWELLEPVPAYASPLEPGVYHYPPNTVPFGPVGDVGVNECWVLDASKETWVLSEDYRKAKVYSTSDGKPITVTLIGPLPDFATLDPCPGDYYVFKSGSGWVYDKGRAYWDCRKALSLERDTRQQEPIAVGDYFFQATRVARDFYSQLQRRGASSLGENLLDLEGEPIRYKTATGEKTALTYDLVCRVLDAIHQRDIDLFNHFEAAKLTLQTAPFPHLQLNTYLVEKLDTFDSDLEKEQ